MTSLLRPIHQGARRLRHHEAVWGYLLVAPNLVVFAAFFFYPVVQAGLYSLTEFGANQLEPRWIGLANPGVLAIILMSWLSGHGLGVVLYLAAMGSIPRSLYEAASLDHASVARQLVRITVPLIKPTTLYLLVISTIGSFQVFEQ